MVRSDTGRDLWREAATHEHPSRWQAASTDLLRSGSTSSDAAIPQFASRGGASVELRGARTKGCGMLRRRAIEEKLKTQECRLLPLRANCSSLLAMPQSATWAVAAFVFYYWQFSFFRLSVHNLLPAHLDRWRTGRAAISKGSAPRIRSVRMCGS